MDSMLVGTESSIYLIFETPKILLRELEFEASYLDIFIRFFLVVVSLFVTLKALHGAARRNIFSFFSFV